MKFLKRIGKYIAVAFGLLVVYGLMAWLQLFGSYEENGRPVSASVPVPEAVEASPGKQILFGDLHVHTTYSLDAFAQSMPSMGGQGSHPPSDACDFARFCSQLDFWSINDHAGGISPWHWETTRQAIRDCNAVAGDPANPDTVAFLGWEWTNISQTPESHWGHKNVIFKDQANDKTPARPIAAKTGFVQIGKGSGITGPMISTLGPLFDPGQAQYYFRQGYYFDSAYNTPYCEAGKSVRDLPADCTEVTETPAELYEKLQDWGYPTLVIPHGNAWGLLVPPESSWVKDLTRGQHNPNIQKLIEVYSGHGNSEEYRSWRHVGRDADGNAFCPEPSEGFLPGCWRAGEIIRERCLKAGEDDATCDARAADTRQFYINGTGSGHYAVPGTINDPDEWLDAGHCKDCFMPTFMHRPMRTAQYAYALRQFDPDGKPIRFRFGMIGSSDTHRARPGTGYKAFARFGMSDTAGPISPEAVNPLTPAPEPKAAIGRDVIPDQVPLAQRTENERRSSYLTTGGLVAVHAEGRDRDAVWNALSSRSTYATSGPRILLWFDMIDDKGDVALPMGGETQQTRAPQFRVKALGGFKQKPGCPDFVEDALTKDRLQALCLGECYNPSTERHKITRIEVVRIRPQQTPDETVDGLVEDVWKTLSCPADGNGCEAEFTDEDFEMGERDTVYYVRAIQEATDKVNGGLMRCTYDAEGNCIAADHCVESYRTDQTDDCLAPVEERAWSSPIFVDFGA